MLQVLVIDDDPMQLWVREAVLRKAGFTVTAAATAKEAFARLASSPPVDVIVTDHLLTGDNGAAFVRRLRGTNAEIPVVVVTGLSEAEQEYRGLNITFLHKPCPPEQLISIVKGAAGVTS